VSDAKRIKLGPATLGEGQLRGYAVGKRNVLVACVGGHLEANTVVCPCHEVGFDLDSGKNVTSPGVCDDQPAYRAEVEDGQVVVIDFPTE
jgi:3-phenylpropionate/trans-cinnamate dioxygenase ferredoxin subunit